MSNYGLVELESYRLAKYSVPMACHICGQGNLVDAELCRHCSAPMALAHQSLTQKLRPRLVGVIGPANAGKTVYLGMLADMLSRGHEELQVFARGAFSISLQQTAMAALRNCRFPDKTPNEPDRWNWLHCQIKTARKRKPIEMIMPDIAGEALMHEIDHPGAFPVIESFLQKCAAALIVVDAAELTEGDEGQDFFAMKIVSYLCELDGNPRSGWPNRPVGLVFTKADQCREWFEQPEVFAQRYAPGLWGHCQDKLERFGFFATGVAGACAYLHELGGRTQIPLRVEPRGIVEPFDWLLKQLGS